jgi:hypothetical protein
LLSCAMNCEGGACERRRERGRRRRRAYLHPRVFELLELVARHVFVDGLPKG